MRLEIPSLGPGTRPGRPRAGGAASWQPLALEPASRARPKWIVEADTTDMTQLRAHIYASKKVRQHYRDEQGRDTERTIWPIAIGYLETVLHLASWCELRKDFRSFRIDRIAQAVFLDEKYPERRAALRVKWMKHMQEKHMQERGCHDGNP